MTAGYQTWNTTRVSIGIFTHQVHIISSFLRLGLAVSVETFLNSAIWWEYGGIVEGNWIRKLKSTLFKVIHFWSCKQYFFFCGQKKQQKNRLAFTIMWNYLQSNDLLKGSAQPCPKLLVITCPENFIYYQAVNWTQSWDVLYTYSVNIMLQVF